MNLVGKFSFVKIEKGKAKETGKDFLFISLLDENKNMVRLFVSDTNFINYIINLKLDFNENVVCILDVFYYSDNWRVSLKDISRDTSK